MPIAVRILMSMKRIILGPAEVKARLARPPSGCPTEVKARGAGRLRHIGELFGGVGV